MQRFRDLVTGILSTVEGISMPKKTRKTLKCQECGTEYVEYRPWQKFCSDKCRWMNWDRKHPRLPSPGSDGRFRFPRLPRPERV